MVNSMETINTEMVCNETNVKIKDKRRLSEKMVLNKEIINASLCDLRQTMDGLSISAVKFICCENSLTNIELLDKFVFLQYINVNFNRLRDLKPLENLKHLIVINAAHNELTSFPGGNWPTLTHLDLSHNLINTLNYIKLPRLMVLLLNNNRIQRLTSSLNGDSYFLNENLPLLHTLSLAHNFIEFEEISTNQLHPFVKFNLNLTNLKALFIGHNRLLSLVIYSIAPVPSNAQKKKIHSIKTKYKSAVGYLPNLSILHVRNIDLLNLDGISIETFPKLEYLNLRNNRIESLEEVKKLRCLPYLCTVILTDNPVFEATDYRLELRTTITSLRRLDKDPYTMEENEEADEIIMKHMEES